MNYKPLFDKIIVLPLKKNSTTKSGLVVIEDIEEGPRSGEVVAVGPGALDSKDVLTKLVVEIGDEIVFNEAGSVEVTIDETLHYIMPEKNVLAIRNRIPE